MISERRPAWSRGWHMGPLLGALAILTTTPCPARADAVALWSQPLSSSATIVGATDLGPALGTSSGYATTLDMLAPGSARVQAYDLAGKLRYAVTASSNPPDLQSAAVAFATDGSGYVARSTPTGAVVDAVDIAGTVRWSTSVAKVRAIAIGPEGDAYVALLYGNQVIRLRASDGTVVFEQIYNPAAHSYIVSLTRTPDGVAAIGPGGVGFISSDGAIRADVRTPVGASTGSQLSSDAAGDVFVAAYNPDACEYPPPAGSGQITRIDVTGTVAWSRQAGLAAPCGIEYLASLPDGGVAFVPTEAGGTALDRVGVLNADGSLRWELTLPIPPPGHGGVEPPLVDTVGHLSLLEVGNSLPCPDNGTQQCVGKDLLQLDAATGRVLGGFSFASHDDRLFRFGYTLVGLGPDRVYVSDCTIDGCAAGALTAFSLPGTTIQYPSGPATTIGTAPPPPPPGPGPKPGPDPTQFVYRAIGDSIPAGFGLHGNGIASIACAGHLPNSDCDFPYEAYPAIIAGIQTPSGAPRNGLQPLPGPLDFRNLSVSGAQTSYWLDPSHLSSVVAAHPNLVTITLGADDLLGNPQEGLACITSVACVRATVAEIKNRLQQLLGDLVRGTSARILITGYHTVPFDHIGAVAWLNSAISSSTTGYGSRVSFVPIQSFDGHHCQDLGASWLIIEDNLCLHPNSVGHTVFARDVLNAWTNPIAASSQPVAEVISDSDQITALGERAIITTGTVTLNVVSVGYGAVHGIAVWLKRHNIYAAQKRGLRTDRRRPAYRFRELIVHPRYADGSATVAVRLSPAERRAHGSVLVEVLRCPSSRPHCVTTVSLPKAHTVARF